MTPDNYVYFLRWLFSSSVALMALLVPMLALSPPLSSFYLFNIAIFTSMTIYVGKQEDFKASGKKPQETVNK